MYDDKLWNYIGTLVAIVISIYIVALLAHYLF